jgi:hypothetical protein
MNSVISSAQGLEVGRDSADTIDGGFLDFAGERYYVIRNVERMEPFFISVISAHDHWLFASSNGGLTAGRVSPETALFPYTTVDKLHDNGNSAGPRTILRVGKDTDAIYWEPFNLEQKGLFTTTCTLYKNTLGNKLCYEEVNHDLNLVFRYTWSTGEEFGFIRHSELENLGDATRQIEVVDGVQNILPAGTPIFTQTNSSNLVDAYKWTELDEPTGLAFLTLYSGITDRAEPCESLKATTVFSVGLERRKILISGDQLKGFRRGAELEQEDHKRGIRGAYFVNHSCQLAGGDRSSWDIVLNTEQSQADVVALRQALRDSRAVATDIEVSVAAGSEKLSRIMASSDGFQATAEEHVSVHHYANVLFNVLRGGIFDDQYNVSSRDFRRTIRQFNKQVFDRNRDLLDALPERLRFDELLSTTDECGDAQLQRLAREYLPITFGRRHGDPSRPWNQFAIRLKDENGDSLLSYQGNWRDIFQNWEALAFSFPEFVENMIAKFVNASTVDGYNPYRITKEGIDWEVEEPDNPWSYIGYWGDHQIIYLLKLLELSRSFHPRRLRRLLHQPLFSYANVPYKIKPFELLVADPKNTVVFDELLGALIDKRTAEIGADGKLVLDAEGEVYQVNLLEKLLVPLLAKLGNLVIDGGIWLNTQRPEWNDANNALVGQGLSMVTLYYMRRYMHFLRDLLGDEQGSFAVSAEVAKWLEGTASAVSRVRSATGNGTVDDDQRIGSLTELGRVASDYRESIYISGGFAGTCDLEIRDIQDLLEDALAITDHSIAANRRDDGLYHAYNVAEFGGDTLRIHNLYAMLEGQVAALSSGAIGADEAADVLDALFESDVYRDDQHSFMLYPDRQLPGFLERNRVAEDQVREIPLLRRMLEANDKRIVLQDSDGCVRFSAEFTNAGDVEGTLDEIGEDYVENDAGSRRAILDLYEDVFNHKAFTGRSGTMFGFEGLGSIYWHMVAKLLLAVEESFFHTLDSGADDATLKRLGDLYYRVRFGIGFNKTPAEYGAFPTDPYSHTPRHAGAQQPGMTGQVKEEVLTRFGELGVRVRNGAVTIDPALLRAREFGSKSRPYCYLDVDNDWQTLTLPASSLAFTWCQVPIVYVLDDDADASLVAEFDDGSHADFVDLNLPDDVSAHLFQRSGRVRKITATFGSSRLFGD